jgi:eukaryotic-like serine/threonine-protein kinase
VLPGFRTVARLGEGSCGEVYALRGPGGEWRAIKFFKAMSVNRRLLVTAHARVAEGGGHPAVATLHAADFDARPYWVMSDYHGERSEEQAVPWTLEDWVEQRLEPEAAWAIVRQVAEGLAFLHRAGVGHCNLKPHNVLISDPDSGTVVLTDFAQGWVGGVYHYEAEDSLLYASPEQLRQPEGLDHGAWGGWDVFAFGMLAFRLLTGRFAYADARRRAWEESCRAGSGGARFTPGQVAATFDSREPPDWGEAPADWEDGERRRIIETCLAHDPENRFGDMREVLAEWARLDEERGLREERQRVLEHRLREARALSTARLAATLASVAFVAALVAALVSFNQYRLTRDELAGLRATFSRTVAEKDEELRRQLAEATRREELARAQTAGAVRETSAIKETLIRSQEQADRLFAVIRDRKPPNHPGFKDYTQEAGELTRFYADFVKRVGQDPGMRLERARALDHLSDLAAARDDIEAAATWQRDALLVWDELAASDPRNIEWLKRRALGALKLAQAEFGCGRTDAAAPLLATARATLEGLAKDHPADDAVRQQLAAARLLEGRLARQQGDPAAALAHYQEATKLLDDLARRTGRLDYRSELAHGYVDMGELARGLDDIEKAVNVQRAVLDQLVAIVEENPDLQMPRFDLARVYGELGEIECEAGNPVKGDQLLNKSLETLDGLLKEDPGAAEFLYQKARRLAALGRARRDQGKGLDAEGLVAEAVGILTKVVAGHPANPYFAYQLGLAEWQQAELLSDLSKTRESIATMHRALNRLDELLARPETDQIQRRQVQVSMAYLIGDLAHRLEEAGDSADALEAFTNAAKRWREVAATYGEDDVTSDALTWCTRRIEELRNP